MKNIRPMTYHCFVRRQKEISVAMPRKTLVVTNVCISSQKCVSFVADYDDDHSDAQIVVVFSSFYYQLRVAR